VSPEAVGVVIAGAAGRMGRMLLGLALDRPGVRLAGALEAAGHPALGSDAGRLIGRPDAGVALTDSLAGVPAGSVLIEFTAPGPSLEHLRAAADRKLAVVLGTTGFSAEQEREIDGLCARVACMQAANMSVGVTVLLEVVREVSRRLGTSFDVEVAETHHRLKKDSPSGTALALARAAVEARGGRLESWGVYGREGLVGERPDEQIGVLALRGGDVIGDHTVHFFGVGERIELTHRAQSREAFAAGALRAAVWLAGRPPGRYAMRDVLGQSE
jgi:4-hydroxy-tetrahydrodipicolinate reductase